MKKVKSNNRSSAAKGNGAPKNVDEYLAGVPQPARSTLNKIRAAIRSAVPPEATETISYRIPAFKYKGVLVWFAAFSNHCSLFPTASVDRKSTRLNSSHGYISYAVFCLKKKKKRTSRSHNKSCVEKRSTSAK